MENNFKSIINVHTRTLIGTRPPCLYHIVIKNLKKCEAKAEILQTNIHVTFLQLCSLKIKKRNILKLVLK